MSISGTMAISHSGELTFISNQEQALGAVSVDTPTGPYTLEGVPEDYAYLWYVDEDSGVGALMTREAFEKTGNTITVDEDGLIDCSVSVYADRAHNIPLPGVTVTVIGSVSNVISRVSDSSGKAVFRLSSDDYMIFASRVFVGVGSIVPMRVERGSDYAIAYEFGSAWESENGGSLFHLCPVQTWADT